MNSPRTTRLSPVQTTAKLRFLRDRTGDLSRFPFASPLTEPYSGLTRGKTPQSHGRNARKRAMNSLTLIYSTCRKRPVHHMSDTYKK